MGNGKRNEAMRGKVRDHATRIRDLWATLSDAISKRLREAGVEHTPENERMVTSVLLLMSARSATRIEINPDDFERLARRAYEVSDTTEGPRRTARLWVARGGMA